MADLAAQGDERDLTLSLVVNRFGVEVLEADDDRGRDIVADELLVSQLEVVQTDQVGVPREVHVEQLELPVPFGISQPSATLGTPDEKPGGGGQQRRDVRRRDVDTGEIPRRSGAPLPADVDDLRNLEARI